MGLHAGTARQNYTLTLVVLTGVCSAYSAMQTLVVPALPTLRDEFGTTTTWVTWVMTSFLLVAAVAAPVAGKLGDQHGKERLLVISLLVLFAGCVLAIFAWNVWSLIAARAIQGGGGAVIPLTFAIIRDEFPPEKVGTALGITSATFAFGGGLGLVLSGVLIDQLSWRWLFGTGAVAVGASALLVQRFVPESPVKTPARIDVAGALLVSTGLAAFLVAVSEGSNWGWTSAATIGCGVVAVAALATWVVVERRVPEPMVDLRVFVERPVLLTNVAAVMTGFAMFGTFVLVPILLQTSRSVADYGLGAGSTATGLYLLPNTIAGVLVAPAAGPLGRRFGTKVPLALGLALGGLGLCALARWHATPSQIVIAMLIVGAGAPLAFAAMAKLIVDSVPETETGVASGINAVMRTVGSVVGGQVGAAILTAVTIAGTSVPRESAFTIAFVVSALAAFVGAAVSVFVTPLRLRRHLPAYETS